MINNINIDVESCIDLLGLKIDCNLTFSEHIFDLCKKTCGKLAALKRIINFTSKDKAALLASAFVMSQFNYSPLTWMFPTKGDNHDYTSSFSELLYKSKGVTIHTKNLQLLMTEVYKFISGLGPSFMSEIFNLATEKYNLRCKHRLTIPKVQSVEHGYHMPLSILFYFMYVFISFYGRCKLAFYKLFVLYYRR